jgi:hypothetical protein
MVVVVVTGSILLPWSTVSAHQILWGRCYAFCIRTHLMKAPDKGQAGVSVSGGFDYKLYHVKFV